MLKVVLVRLCLTLEAEHLAISTRLEVPHQAALVLLLSLLGRGRNMDLFQLGALLSRNLNVRV